MCSASHLSRYGHYARAALIDADPELHTRPRFNGCVSFGHFLLHREHASDPTPKPSLDVSMMLPPYFATIWQGSGPGDALRSRTVAPSSALSVLKLAISAARIAANLRETFAFLGISDIPGLTSLTT